MKNNKTEAKQEFLFEKTNYQLMLIGVAIITLGFVLMSGGGTENIAVFNADVFSFTKIRVAPTVVLVGFGVVIFSIFKKRK